MGDSYFVASTAQWILGQRYSSAAAGGDGGECSGLMRY
jgi:hypothetical protein